MHKKLLITLVIILGALYTISQANIILNFSDISIQSFKDTFSSVHFIAPGNNFVGGIFWLPTVSIAPIEISLGSHHKTCTKQIRGLYFNSQRGQRIWPLDADSLELLKQQNSNYNTLTIDGGLYTTCDSGNNYGIFGAITYHRGGITSYLIAGTKLQYQTNKMQAYMANSFQYFDNKVPIGYLYDSYGGIGYVGGILTGHEALITYLNNGGTIQNGFAYSGTYIVSNNPQRETLIESGYAAMQTMRNLIIQGSVGLSKSMNEKERISLLGNLQEKTVIYNGSDINSSTVINFAKKRAQELCQEKESYTNPILMPTPETIICVEGNLTIPLANTNAYKNKTIIVKNGNILLQGGMEENFPPLDIFIDKGILYLPDPIDPINFNAEGFPAASGTNSGLYLKGNFIINGLIAGNLGIPFNHKLHLQGKIIMLNTPTHPTQGRIDQIEELLGIGHEQQINLQNVYKRTCSLEGIGSDGSSCDGNSVISRTPFVILNGNYPSNILQ